MSMISANLEVLNVARKMNNKAPLKSWKESNEKLIALIDKEQEIFAHAQKVKEIAEKANVPVDAVKATVERLAAEAVAANEKISRKRMTSGNAPVKPIDTDALSDRAKATRKPATQKIAAAVAAAKTRVKQTKTITPKAKQDREGAVVNVAAIAKELGINAKVARATIRRKNIDRTDAAAIRAALAKK